MKHFHQILLVSLLLFANILTANDDTDTSSPLFNTVANEQDYIKSEREAALKENKLLLWVLGGNWCHDSRSLASKLTDNSLAPLIAKHYRLSMIDVGYLNQGFDFTKIAGMKTFYATPTVLIIDPETMTQTNAQDMFIWSNAYQVSQDDTNAYFTRYSNYDATMSSHSDGSGKDKLNAELQTFINQQEERILASYLVIGPMLKAYKDDKAAPEFDSYWNALYDVRFALQKHIDLNRKKIADWQPGQQIELEFPEHNPLPWENTKEAD